MISLLLVIIVALAGFILYLIKLLQEEKRNLKKLKSKKKPNELSDEEKQRNKNIDKAFRYTKKNISDVNSRMFKEAFNSLYEDIKQEEEAKRRLKDNIEG